MTNFSHHRGVALLLRGGKMGKLHYRMTKFSHHRGAKKRSQRGRLALLLRAGEGKKRENTITPDNLQKEWKWNVVFCFYKNSKHKLLQISLTNFLPLESCQASCNSWGGDGIIIGDGITRRKKEKCKFKLKEKTRLGMNRKCTAECSPRLRRNYFLSKTNVNLKISDGASFGQLSCHVPILAGNGILKFNTF